MQLSFTTLDVFTATPYLGNQLAIVKVPAFAKLSQFQKQSIAREFNLSEIVFLHERTPEDIQNQDARIDIFTSLAEVPFAGHPTIGTAYYLFNIAKDTTVEALQTKAGRKAVTKTSTGVTIHLAHNVRIHASPFAGQPFEHHPVVSIVKGMTFILAKLSNLEELARQTDNLLKRENTYTSANALDPGWQEGIVCTFFYVDLGCDSDGTRLLRTRMFGSREDPGTGSASSALCAYLTLEESGELARKYHLMQGVEMGRRCDIFVDVEVKESGAGVESVVLSGVAAKSMEGVLEVPEEV